MSENWNGNSQNLGFVMLMSWMFTSKFIKLMGHYIRYPVDFLLLPISIVFGYLHGLIKVYAMISLNVVCCFTIERYEICFQSLSPSN